MGVLRFLGPGYALRGFSAVSRLCSAEISVEEVGVSA